MTIDRRKYLYRIKRLEIKSWLKYLMIEGKSVVDYVLGELTTGTDITINNTVEKKFYKFDIKGNSTQDGTPTPDSPVEIYSAGDEYTLYSNDFEQGAIGNNYNQPYNNCKNSSTTRIRTINLVKLNPNKSYNISFNTNYQVVIQAFNDSGLLYNVSGTTNIWRTTSFTFNGIPYIGIAIRKSNEANIIPSEYNNVNFKLQQNDGMSGTISEKIVNKNWFNKETTTSQVGYFTATGELKSGGNSTVTTSYTQILPNTNMYLSGVSLENVCYYDENFNFIERVTNTTSRINKNAKYIRFQTATSNFNLDNVQLELGTSATTYVAHQEQTYIIPVQQPMRSIGTVRDKFIKLNGNWFERHNIGRVVLDGTEDWTQTGSQPTVYYTTKITGYKTTNNIPLSNYFVGKNNVASPTVLVGLGDNIIAFISTTDNIRFYLNSSIFNSANELKTWLQSHNTEILYLPITPIDIPCTSEQISILENLPTSYNEQTNIYSLDVTPAYIEVQAYVKKEEVIEND